jgi:sugar lactone lactonase YvrE
MLTNQVSNAQGLGWSPDQKTFYWTDTKTGCVFAFDYDAASGYITNRRVGVEVDKSIGHPGGLTIIDVEGLLWTTLWAGHGLARWNPATEGIGHQGRVSRGERDLPCLRRTGRCSLFHHGTKRP